MMNQPDATAWREQMVHRLEKACLDSHSALNEHIQKLIQSMKDQYEQEQHKRKLLEETLSVFKIQLMSGAYDQQSLDEIDAQLRDLVLIKHNSLIFGRYMEVQRPALLAYTRTLTNLTEPEDLLEDASEAACKAFNKYPQLIIDNLDAWFHKILLNTSKNMYRKATAKKRGTAESLEAREEEQALEAEADENDQPEMALLRKESQEIVAELILHLPLTYQRTMTLYLLYDWSVQQIADHLQLSVNTVKSQLWRSLPLLRIGFLHRQVRIAFLNRQEELDAHLLTLPGESRQTMRLFVTLGPQYQEIAKRLGPPHTPETVTDCIERYLPILAQLPLIQGL